MRFKVESADQKTFGFSCVQVEKSRLPAKREQTKAFCFFLSKKKALPCFLRHHPLDFTHQYKT